jgi:type II secretory pathway component PulC
MRSTRRSEEAMRLILLAVALAGAVIPCCGHSEPAQRPPEAPVAEPPPEPTFDGAIRRSQIVTVTQGGPGVFLQHVQLVPARAGGRFLGFRIRTWFPGNPELRTDRVRVGDIVLSVNDQGIVRPEHLMAVWSTLPSATELRVRLLRDGAEVLEVFPIVED